MFEYAIARYVNELKQAGRERKLTRGEREFLKRTRALIERLKAEERQ